MNMQLFDAITQLDNMLLPGNLKKNYAQVCADIDTLLLEELIAQGYYTENAELSDEVLKQQEARNAQYGQETVYDRLNKLRATQSNLTPQKAVPHWLGNAQRTMLQFLEKYAVGDLNQMYIDEHGIVHVTIDCVKGHDNDGRWEARQAALETVGIELAKEEIFSSYYIPDTSDNLSNIIGLFKNNRAHVNASVSVAFGEIKTVMLEMNAEDMETFEVAAVGNARPEATETRSEQLTKRESVLLKNEIKSFKTAMSYLNTAVANHLLACRNFEISFALICGVLNVDSRIKSIVDKRYHEEQVAAKECCAVSEAIGKTFNPKDMEEVVVRMVRDMDCSLYEQLGFNIKDVKIAPANERTVWAHLKYAIPRNSRKHTPTPRPQDDTTQWDIHPKTKQLLSTERNHKKILDFCRAHDVHLIHTRSEYNRVAQDFIIKTVDIYQIF